MVGKRHSLKIWPEFFQAVASGEKTFEVRRNDRWFAVGDILDLLEWEPPGRGPKPNDPGGYTGRACSMSVTYRADADPSGPIQAEHVVLGMRPMFSDSKAAAPPIMHLTAASLAYATRDDRARGPSPTSPASGAAQVPVGPERAIANTLQDTLSASDGFDGLGVVMRAFRKIRAETEKDFQSMRGVMVRSDPRKPWIIEVLFPSGYLALLRYDASQFGTKRHSFHAGDSEFKTLGEALDSLDLPRELQDDQEPPR